MIVKIIYIKTKFTTLKSVILSLKKIKVTKKDVYKLFI